MTGAESRKRRDTPRGRQCDVLCAGCECFLISCGTCPGVIRCDEGCAGCECFFLERIFAHVRESSDAMRHVRGANVFFGAHFCTCPGVIRCDEACAGCECFFFGAHFCTCPGVIRCDEACAGASFLVFISARDINKTDTGCSVLCAPTYQREYSNTDVTCMSMSVLWRISYKLGLGAAFCGHSLPKTSDQGNIMSA